VAAEGGEVGAGAERPPRAGDDHRVHAGIGFGPLNGGPKLRRHRGCDRVAAVGIIDGYQRHPIGDGEQYELGICHRG